MDLEEALDTVAKKIADELQEMYPDSDTIDGEILDRAMYDVEILGDLQDRAVDILIERGFLKEEEDEEEPEEDEDEEEED